MLKLVPAPTSVPKPTGIPCSRDFDALVRYGTISPGDIELMYRTDSIDDAYEWLTRELLAKALAKPGPTL